MKDHWKTVDGWAAFENLYRQMVHQTVGPARFVEVGSWLGKSACLMAELIQDSQKAIEFVCIDPWIDGGPDLRDTNHFRKLQRPPFEIFLENCRPFSGIIRPLRMFSTDAAHETPDESVDFLMLDGDHNYEGIRDDIDAWLPKMKPGGIMSGDDYTWPGVKTAVDESFGKRAQISYIKRHPNYKMEASYWCVAL